MIKIVQESRKEMAGKLIKQGMSEDEAKEKAATHIRATLDTGHLNNWRQHFQAKEGESEKQVDARF